MSSALVDAFALLGAAQAKGIDPSLEPIEAMLDQLGNPDIDYECVQVVGTNGKTSTARYAASILAGEGLRVGLFCSPCLVNYLDQIEIAGERISKDAFAKAVVNAADAGRKVNELRTSRAQEPFAITEFDLLTTAALVAFSEAGVDVAVLEAGLGAQWDATSAARSIKSVCETGIGLDHTRILGSTKQDIAQNKACAIRAGRSCVLGPGTLEDADVRNVMLSRCASEGVCPAVVLPEGANGGAVADARHVTFGVTARPNRLGAPLQMWVRTPRGLYADLGALKPAYQASNIACAVALAEEVRGGTLDAEVLFDSIATCATPGRFDLVRPDPAVLVDACHNPQSVEAFVDAVRDIVPCVEDRPVLLCAVFADKDVDAMVDILCREFKRVVVTQTTASRCMMAGDLAKAFEKRGVMPLAVTSTVAEAVSLLDSEPFVACGSITLAGAVKECFAHGYDGMGDA